MAFFRDEVLFKSIKEEFPNELVADIGCSKGKLAGTIGVDIMPHKGVDILTDLNQTPWPIKDNSLVLIFFNNIIEHLHKVIKTMEEIHRILKPNGLVVIRTPHFSHCESFKDPTHIWHLTYESFDYFIRGKELGLYSNKEFEYIERQLLFSNNINGIIGKLFFKLSIRRYEKYHCKKHPSNGLYFILKAIKK
jgi:SAM-dependent methyltransferase